VQRIRQGHTALLNASSLPIFNIILRRESGSFTNSAEIFCLLTAAITAFHKLFAASKDASVITMLAPDLEVNSILANYAGRVAEFHVIDRNALLGVAFYVFSTLNLFADNTAL